MKKLMLLAAVLVGCGGGGPSDSERLSDLSQSEAQELCEELADDYPERTVTCEGFTLTIGFNKAECAADSAEPTPATCTLTVGDARDCAGALFELSDMQICTADTLPAACAGIDEC